MDDDKLFQYLISRIQVRETSTLTVAAIASSASLILMGLFGTESGLINAISLIGFLSPIIGFLYFEITFATQQSWDYDSIREIIDKEATQFKEDKRNKIIIGKNRTEVLPKQALWRILLALPVIGWFSLLSKDLNLIILIILISACVISFLIYRIERKKDKVTEKSKKSPLPISKAHEKVREFSTKITFYVGLGFLASSIGWFFLTILLSWIMNAKNELNP